MMEAEQWLEYVVALYTSWNSGQKVSLLAWLEGEGGLVVDHEALIPLLGICCSTLVALRIMGDVLPE